MKNSFIELLERQESIQKLIDHGHSKLVDVLLMESSYTKKGRLNKSAVCRELGCKPKELENALEECKSILLNDYGWEEEYED